ncbi:hypothetical protein QBC41DRAFT_148832 [Cercophora samala]|uniref:Uncharacterized protein n=1 Tax=Cercophora samala TaxID=330535 RepID=A0AA39Z952_9PEZI|nr:hypothetical protein QBC41DRAFT_148832 [Cercophora samala]
MMGWHGWLWAYFLGVSVVFTRSARMGSGKRDTKALRKRLAGIFIIIIIIRHRTDGRRSSLAYTIYLFNTLYKRIIFSILTLYVQCRIIIRGRDSKRCLS